MHVIIITLRQDFSAVSAYVLPRVWVPCHHDVVHPHVANEQNALQTLKVAANGQHKYLNTADKG